MTTHIVHPFETAGLGLAPFRLTGVTEKWFSIPGMPGTTKPGSCCDFCYTGIAFEFWIRSSDGKTFKVGSECVRKTQDKALIDATDRAEARLKLQLRHAKEAARIAELQTKLEDSELQAIMSSMPHPYQYQADKGLTRLDWATWMMAHAGNKGKMDVTRFVKQIESAKIDIGTQTQRYQEAQKLAARKVELDAAATEKLNVEAARKAALLNANTWLIDALAPYSNGLNRSVFAASISDQLTYTRFQDLSYRQKQVVAEILAKEVGRKNSTVYNTRYEEILAKLN